MASGSQVQQELRRLAIAPMNSSRQSAPARCLIAQELHGLADLIGAGRTVSYCTESNSVNGKDAEREAKSPTRLTMNA
jgi:hypothetical protein